jgi:hypothetical protein
MSAIRRNPALSVTIGIAALLLLAAGASSLAAARGAAAAPAETPPVLTAQPAGDAAASCGETAIDGAAPKKPCRGACPDKPYCTCTYNGQPRVSCDPCCYQTYTGEICLD